MICRGASQRPSRGDLDRIRYFGLHRICPRTFETPGVTQVLGDFCNGNRPTVAMDLDCLSIATADRNFFTVHPVRMPEHNTIDVNVSKSRLSDRYDEPVDDRNRVRPFGTPQPGLPTR
ncbi:MAG: hypothetical protein WBF93_22180 [Pirellulales bacterium]|nr:hypothetical protein [Pirellulales bacterium]